MNRCKHENGRYRVVQNQFYCPDCGLTYNGVNANDWEVVLSILSEVANARAKHNKWPKKDILLGIAIVGEEAGEALRCVVQYKQREFGGATIEDIRKEVIQTAAVCIRFLTER